MRRLLILPKIVLVVVLSGALVAGALSLVGPELRKAAAANRAQPEKIDLSVLNDFTVRSYIYAADGSLISTLQGPENRTVVPLDQMGDTLIRTVLANEDEHFYEHAGVNVKATFRALLENVSSADVEQGGSTITQQLVKNIYLTSNQTLDRKTKEVALALRLEQQLTDTARSFGSPDPRRAAKDKILETYLNTVYFGSGAYGVQAAAETYFGKNATELDWAESALLAALIPSPVGNDPTLYPDRAKRQRALVLDRLVQLDAISEADANRAKLAPLPVVRCQLDAEGETVGCGNQALPAPTDYFSEEVKQALLHDPAYGLGDTYTERYNEVFGGGLRITTTIDPAAQAAQEQAVREGIPKNSIGVTAAAVSVEPSTGAVRAMVGGPGFEQFKYNIATHQPGRQTGSAFKTLVLLAALEAGNVPADYVDGGGSFKNPGGEPNPYKVSGGGGSLTDVTKVSSNGAYVRLGQIVGLDNVIELAKKVGITSALQPVISLPLGVAETTPIEMASAYAAIANGGIHQPYYLIEKIEDREGNVLYQHQPNGTRAFSAQTACLATEVLKANVDGGTGTRARLGRQQVAGKTGTTEDHSDAWFIGYTPYLVTAVWMGNPQERVAMNRLGPKGPAFGGTYAAPIWKAFNAKYHENLPPKDFPKCDKTRRGGKVTGPGAKSKDLPPGTGTTRRPTSSTTTTTSPPAAGGDDPPAPAPAPADPPPEPEPTVAPTTSAPRGNRPPKAP